MVYILSLMVILYSLDLGYAFLMSTQTDFLQMHHLASLMGKRDAKKDIPDKRLSGLHQSESSAFYACRHA